MVAGADAVDAVDPTEVIEVDEEQRGAAPGPFGCRQSGMNLCNEGVADRQMGEIVERIRTGLRGGQRRAVQRGCDDPQNGIVRAAPRARAEDAFPHGVANDAGFAALLDALASKCSPLKFVERSRCERIDLEMPQPDRTLGRNSEGRKPAAVYRHVAQLAIE
jgi:hypothetical protein